MNFALKGGQLESGMLLSKCRGKDCSGLDFGEISTHVVISD